MSQVSITVSFSDGSFSKNVEITRTEALVPEELPSYGEPGYDSNRQRHATDWDRAMARVPVFLREAGDEFLDQLQDAKERDVAKVNRINAAKGVMSLDEQTARDSVSDAVDRVVTA